MGVIRTVFLFVRHVLRNRLELAGENLVLRHKSLSRSSTQGDCGFGTVSTSFRCGCFGCELAGIPCWWLSNSIRECRSIDVDGRMNTDDGLALLSWLFAIRGVPH